MEHEKETLYRNLHSKLHSNRAHLTVTKSNVIDQSLKARLTRCSPSDAPLLMDMLAILDAERSMNNGSEGICIKKEELAEELFEDLLMDYVAVQSMNKDNQESKGIMELVEMINCTVDSDIVYKEQMEKALQMLRQAAKPKPTPEPKTIIEVEDTKPVVNNSGIVTARQLLGGPAPSKKPAQSHFVKVENNPQRKFLGGKRRIDTQPNGTQNGGMALQGNREEAPSEPVDERLQNIEPRLIEMIRNEMLHKVDQIGWDNIAGLEHAKSSIKEIVVWPMLRPDIFTGLRGPPKGLLLFGPPGTGKTMIGKCIASQAKASFFSISASSLTSKWVGEGEKLVRALFAVARCSQPAVIFIDEIDSLLTQRTDGEFEASRRIKTEFLVQFDGAGTSTDDRILIIGATNRPQEIDEAARRRLVKRLYIPLPDTLARESIIRNLISTQLHNLSPSDIKIISERTEGYSGSDVDNLCREASLGPIRCIKDILNIAHTDVRPINLQDFEHALTQVRASVSQADLSGYIDWNVKFGSLSM